MMRDRLSMFTHLLLRDGATCYLCGQGVDSADPFQIEHVMSRAHGGSDDLTNLRLAHGSCNRAKGTRSVS
jgi:5-methylcytosine-specific restriction endonuclease McrA